MNPLRLTFCVHVFTLETVETIARCMHSVFDAPLSPATEAGLEGWWTTSWGPMTVDLYLNELQHGLPRHLTLMGVAEHDGVSAVDWVDISQAVAPAITQRTGLSVLPTRGPQAGMST